MPARRKKTNWEKLGDEELLDWRFCDFKLTISGTHLEDRINQLYQELARRDIRFRPHCWLAEEWFSPDGVPGIGIPFYMAHPRLAKLEFHQMFEVEGGSARYCMQLLRHEAGHAICTAFRLHRRKRWRRFFGRFSKPYPDYYIPNTKSRNHVLHLDWWYAQSHPAEDFAETFAVWLRPKSDWRRQYRNWPAIRKLEYVNELMQEIAGKTAPVRSRRKVEPLSTVRKTLREHYRAKREHYGIEIPEIYDGELRRLFPDYTERNGTRKRRSAAAFLRKIRPEISQLCAHGIGESPYVIAQLLQDMIVRCREMKLYVNRPEEEMKIEVAVFVSLQTLNFLHNIRHRIAV